jgi:hypothetical protein
MQILLLQTFSTRFGRHAPIIIIIIIIIINIQGWAI